MPRSLVYTGDQLRWHCVVTYEFSPTLKKITRIDYGVLDWASNVGGLYNLLSKFFLFLLSFITAGGAHLFVGTQLQTN